MKPFTNILNIDFKLESFKISLENKYILWVSLAALLLSSFVFRLINLNSGLWLDEILTYVSYANLPFSEIVTTFNSENQHFLYSILAHTSFIIFGESAWALRLPAVIFGVGSIWAVYLLGSQVANRREGLLAAALLAFSYHHVWFSQNARGYTGLLFWTTLSSWFLVRGLQENQRRIWIYYAISVALGMYTHLTMGFVLLGHLITYLVTQFIRFRRDESPRWAMGILGISLAGFLSILLYAPVITQILNIVGGTEQSVVAAWKNPLWTLLELISGLRISFAGGVFAAGAILLFGLGVVSYASTRPILLGVFLLPIIIGAGFTLAIGHHLWPRFFFFEFGLAVLVVVRGALILGDFIVRQVSRFITLPDWSLFWAGPLLASFLILVSALSIPLAYGPKQDFGGALEYINSNTQPGDSVVVVSLTTFPYREYYKMDWESVATLEELMTIRRNSYRTWLVYTFPPVLESVHPDIMENIKKDFIQVRSFPGTVSGGAIIVSRADKPISGLLGVDDHP